MNIISMVLAVALAPLFRRLLDEPRPALGLQAVPILQPA